MAQINVMLSSDYTTTTTTTNSNNSADITNNSRMFMDVDCTSDFSMDEFYTPSASPEFLTPLPSPLNARKFFQPQSKYPQNNFLSVDSCLSVAVNKLKLYCTDDTTYPASDNNNNNNTTTTTTTNNNNNNNDNNNNNLHFSEVNDNKEAKTVIDHHSKTNINNNNSNNSNNNNNINNSDRSPSPNNRNNNHSIDNERSPSPNNRNNNHSIDSERSPSPNSHRSKCWREHPAEIPVITKQRPSPQRNLSVQETDNHHSNHTIKHLSRHQTIETTEVHTQDSENEQCINQYIIKEEIGTGSYGKVKLVVDKVNGKERAMKQISRRLLKRRAFQRRGFSKGARGGSTGDTELQSIRKEIAVQKKLDHPYIVKLFEVLDDESKNEIYLVLEYIKNGTIMEIGKDSALSEETSHTYFVHLLLGIEYLHNQNIAHRDIKPENLLLDDDGKLKIADFGESEDLSGPGDHSSKNVGTPSFFAPEMMQSSTTHDAKISDIWAMGVTLYCLLYGELPFKGDTRQELFESVKNVNLEFSSAIYTSAEVKDLLIRMLDKDPASRITLDSIRVHPWVVRAGELVSKSDNCSEYIEVTEEEVNSAISYCTNSIAALVMAKLMVHKRTFGININLLRSNSSDSAQIKHTTRTRSVSDAPSVPSLPITNKPSPLLIKQANLYSSDETVTPTTTQLPTTTTTTTTITPTTTTTDTTTSNTTTIATTPITTITTAITTTDTTTTTPPPPTTTITDTTTKNISPTSTEL